jgi:transcriptional regulator with XRE-family HTH domain
MQNQRSTTIHDPRYVNSIKVLVKARKSACLSQSELAAKIGFTQPDISKIERFERRLDITEFFDVLNAISNGDRLLFDQLWKQVNECHYRSATS